MSSYQSVFKKNKKKVLLDIKCLGQSTNKQVISHLKTEANKYIGKPIVEPSFNRYRVFFNTGNRQKYEQLYFKKRKRLTLFGLLLLHEPDKAEYREELENTIFSICQEFTWSLPAHVDQTREEEVKELHLDDPITSRFTLDLFACETAFTLSEITALLQDQLDPFLVQYVKKEIYRRVLHPFVNDGPFHWETSTDNWAGVCASSIGATALYLVDDHRQLSLLIEKVIHTLNCFLSGFAEDGACMEGYQYWQYGFGYFVYFADLLNNRTAGAINLFTNQSVAAIATFQQQIFLDERFVANFSDSPAEVDPDISLSHFLMQQFPEIEAPPAHLRAVNVIDHCGRWPKALRSLIWFNPCVNQTGWKENIYYLPDAQIFLVRSMANEARFAFACKGGSNNEPHNHNDVGQFILYGNGQVFHQDLGAGQYNKEYFGHDRYEFLVTGAQGHAVPVINGYTQVAGSDRKAKVIQVEHSAAEEKIELELSSVYQDPTLKMFTRTFHVRKEKIFTLNVQDNYLFDDYPKQIVEQFIMADLPYEIKEGVIHFRGNKGALDLLYNTKLVNAKINKKNYLDHFGKPKSCLVVQFTPVYLEKNLSLVFQFQVR